MVEVEGWKRKRGRRPRQWGEGMWLRWKDGKGKENSVRNNGERVRGYVVEVERMEKEKRTSSVSMGRVYAGMW